MLSFKVVAILLLAGFRRIECSVLAHGVVAPAVAAPAVAVPAAVHAVPAAVPAVPAVRYGLVAPQNIRPFAAQVSTFTKGLSVFAAPYAAGVLSGPAIVSRAIVPAPAAVAPAPVGPAFAPAPVVPYGVASAPIYPAIAPAVAPAAVPAAIPAPAVPVAPSLLLPEPFARSIHAVAPSLYPEYPVAAPALPAAPLLG